LTALKRREVDLSNYPCLRLEYIRVQERTLNAANRTINHTRRPDDMEIEEAGQEWRVTVLD
jgi:hypothetical protein